MAKCFLCGCNCSTWNRRAERHHIFGGANRPLSEKYGLVVVLCHQCHNEPPYGVHHNAESMQFLHEYGQKKAMQEQGWTADEFRQVFGRNYINDK